MVVEELRNERVDVIQFDDNPSAYVANALSPAKVNNVIVDETTHYATVIVPDDQLSLAIGKEGQNARLAARLTGWHIDIKSSSLMSDLPVMVTTLFDDDDQESEAESGRCEYVSPDGIRCRNHAQPHSKFCRLHESAALVEAMNGLATDEGDDNELLGDELPEAREAREAPAGKSVSDNASDKQKHNED
jgi:N utilization substance protein A